VRPVTFNEQQIGNLRERGAELSAAAAAGNKATGEALHSVPRMYRSFGGLWGGGNDTHLPRGPMHPVNLAGRGLMYGAPFLAEWALRGKVEDLQRQSNMRDLMNRYSQPVQ
jgi:hypothetical protein